GGTRLRDRLLERPAPEVVPEPLQPCAPALELGQTCCLFRREPLRTAQPLVGGLTLREHAPVVLGDGLAALALLLLGRKLADEAFEKLVPRLPESAQLVKHQRRKRRLGDPEAAFERAQHLLYALSRALLLLDAVLQAVDFLLQLAIGLLQLRAVAEQGEHAMVILRSVVAAEIDLQEAELSKRHHETNGGGPPVLTRRR